MAFSTDLSKKQQATFNRWNQPKAAVTYNPSRPKKPFVVQYRNQLWRFASSAAAYDFAAKL